MMYLLKNTFPLYGKAASTLRNLWKNRQKMVSTSRSIVCLYKLTPPSSIILSTRRKKLGIKQYCFQQTKNSFLLAEMKDCLKNMSPLKEKLLPLAPIDCYLRKWKEIVSTSRKNSFNWSKYGLSLIIRFY